MRCQVVYEDGCQILVGVRACRRVPLHGRCCLQSKRLQLLMLGCRCRRQHDGVVLALRLWLVWIFLFLTQRRGLGWRLLKVKPKLRHLPRTLMSRTLPKFRESHDALWPTAMHAWSILEACAEVLIGGELRSQLRLLGRFAQKLLVSLDVIDVH